jgi:hypothetical protein
VDVERKDPPPAIADVQDGLVRREGESVRSQDAVRHGDSTLTLQLALGFALTIASVPQVPVWADTVGWRFAMVPLAAGPLCGTAAMLRLRTSPAALRHAGMRP